MIEKPVITVGVVRFPLLTFQPKIEQFNMVFTQPVRAIQLIQLKVSVSFIADMLS
jgi:hypothetical protein